MSGSGDRCGYNHGRSETFFFSLLSSDTSWVSKIHTIPYPHFIHRSRVMYSQRNKFRFDVLLSVVSLVLASPVVEPKLYAWSCDERPSVYILRETGRAKEGWRLTPRWHDETLLFATRSDTVELLDIRLVQFPEGINESGQVGIDTGRGD